MHMMWFTERAYHYDPEVEPEKYRRTRKSIMKVRSFYGTPNSFFDPQHGAKVLNQYLDEKVYTDQELLNFDGVMLNEHHGTPFCLGSVMDVEAAVLAAKTKRVKIVLLGNPVATVAQSAAAGRRARDDRSDLGRPPGFRMGARRGQRAVRQQHQSGAQSRAV